jgi:hypothetical protein
MIQARQVAAHGGFAFERWILPAMVGTAVALGAIIGTESGWALLAGGACAVPLLFTISISWLASLSVVAALAFRLAAPAAIGPVALIPDALVIVLFARILADLALGRGQPLPPGMKRMLWPLAGFLGLTLASAVANGDSLLLWGQSMRQFLRFPIWALVLSMTGLGVRDARRLVNVLLAMSLLQFPLVLYQVAHPASGAGVPGAHFFQGDNISGTFGFGGSSSAMIFLVICSVIWLPLVFERVVSAWLLWILAPFLILPMAMGSAVSYVLFLPLGILGLIIRALSSRRFRLTGAGLLTAGLLLAVSVWAAGALALAPGFAGSDQPSGTAVLSQAYLSRYISESGGSSQPGSRLGFFRFAIGSDLRAGGTGITLGHGPGLAILDRSGPGKLEGELGDHSALATRSVQSLQRLLIGFGFVAPGLFLLIIVLPVLGVRRARARDPMIRALLSAMPVAALVYILAGVYNAPWSDPGVSAAFWTLVVASYSGVLEAESLPDEETGDSEEPGGEDVSPATGRGGPPT